MNATAFLASFELLSKAGTFQIVGWPRYVLLCKLKTLLIKGYANEEKPCDGEIYRKIREYQFLPGRTDSNVSPATCVSLEMFW